jgi:hypothetical protein
VCFCFYFAEKLKAHSTRSFLLTLHAHFVARR